MVGEFGADDTGQGYPEWFPNEQGELEQTQLREGLVLHNGIWSAAHLGSSAMYWWPRYIQERNLYKELQALIRYWKDEDPVLYSLAPVHLMLSGGPVNSGILINPGLNGFYESSSQTDFDVQADGSVPGIENLSIWLHGDYHPEFRSDPTFRIPLGRDGNLKIHVQDISAVGNLGLRVLVDSQSVYSCTFENGLSDFVITVPVPAGQHEIQIQNTGEDWFRVQNYEFTGFDQLATKVIGLASKNHAYLWFYDIGSQYHYKNNGILSGVQATLHEMEDGPYAVEVHETWRGGSVIAHWKEMASSGNLKFTLPDFTKDIAVKIRPYEERPVPTVFRDPSLNLYSEPTPLPSPTPVRSSRVLFDFSVDTQLWTVDYFSGQPIASFPQWVSSPAYPDASSHGSLAFQVALEGPKSATGVILNSPIHDFSRFDLSAYDEVECWIRIAPDAPPNSVCAMLSIQSGRPGIEFVWKQMDDADRVILQPGVWNRIACPLSIAEYIKNIRTIGVRIYSEYGGEPFQPGGPGDGWVWVDHVKVHPVNSSE